VKEDIIVCLDNSEFMRNGDILPSRMESQLDAINFLCGNKSRANVENRIGLLSMAGKNPNVEVALCSSLGKILSTLTQVKINGDLKFSNSISISQLVLKKRTSDQSAVAQRRIIAFVGTPIKESKTEMKKIGETLKKNGIHIDIINFGESKKKYIFIGILNYSFW